MSLPLVPVFYSHFWPVWFPPLYPIIFLLWNIIKCCKIFLNYSWFPLLWESYSRIEALIFTASHPSSPSFHPTAPSTHVVEGSMIPRQNWVKVNYFKNRVMQGFNLSSFFTQSLRVLSNILHTLKYSYISQ